MKKILNFLRSMRFGIMLLVLIAALSAVGSVIPQGESVSWYAANYGSAHGLILMLKLNDVYKSPYFALLLTLLCVNLTLCSVVRIKGVAKASKTAVENAMKMPAIEKVTPAERERLRSYLKKSRCKETLSSAGAVFSGRDIGRYGTFITHVAILMTVIFGAGALYLPVTKDEACIPGEVLVMEDGTGIAVRSFRIEDASGRLDFTSEIVVVSPSGRDSGLRTISVNHPLSFGGYKIYQQTYGTAGSVTVRDPESGATDDFTLRETSFLSADEVNGIWYQNVYPGFVEGENGSITLITSTSGSYPDPVYEIMLADKGNISPMLCFPGDVVTVGELEFIFNEPVEYPGLRIKHTPTAINVLLVISFVLMIVGLYITFFMPPVLVKLDETGYTVCGPKPEYTRLKLKMLLEEGRDDR